MADGTPKTQPTVFDLLAQRGLVYVDDALAKAITRDRVRAAAQAADVQRALDLHHLGQVRVETDLGPAVLWRDVVRVMPVGGAS